MIDNGTQPTNDIKISPLLELCSTDMTSLPSMTPGQLLEWYQTQLQSNASDGLIFAVNNGYLDSNGFFTLYSASEQDIIGNSLSTWYVAGAYRCPITCNAGEYLWWPDGPSCAECPMGYYCPAESVTYTASEYNTSAELGKTICPAGTYQDQVGQTECLICPDNKTSPEGAASVEQCIIDTSYTITLNTDSGTFPTGVVVPTEYTDSDLPLTLPVPTRAGYEFGGWYDNAEFTGTLITEIPTGSTGNKEYWAKWVSLCPADWFVPTNHPEMCFPQVLHLSNERPADIIYLKTTATTTPAFNLTVDGTTYHANLTTTQTRMTDTSEHYLQIKVGGVDYFVCDDTTCPGE